ncbi:MAG: hypothetical protein V7L21_28155 [Nostoc sp.]|uniref:hypothetical protein n=1 Tax=Nostoc sp. TaxID=1180 RepID=UPI002FFAD980
MCDHREIHRTSSLPLGGSFADCSPKHWLKLALPAFNPARDRSTFIKIGYLLQKMAGYEDIAILSFVSLLHEEGSNA